MPKIHLFFRTICPIILYATILTIGEIAYRAIFEFPKIEKITETFAIFTLFLGLFVWSKWRLGRWLIGGFVLLSLLANNVHFAIYQSWITGMNYYLLLAEITEVMTASQNMLPKLLPHIAWAIVEIGVFGSILYWYQSNQKRTIADVIFILAMLFISIRSFDTPQKQGISPDSGYSRLKAHYFSMGYFMGHILPTQLLHLSKVAAYQAPEPRIISRPKIRNIILIMGESESAKNIQHFGYPRPTSPFFTQLAQQYPESIIKPVYSAGKMTFVSLPMFFNMAEKPNAFMHINKGTSNLFRLAQQQGFHTSFHTSQPETEMELINLIGSKWLNRITYPTELGYPKTSGMNDHLLLPYLQKHALHQGQNLIVLHQRGSHAPYAHYLSEQEKYFKNGSHLDNYDSSIRHTNLFIKQVFEHLKQQTQTDWLLIYTSDHGQHVTTEVFNQGTNEDAQYTVPLMIYSPDTQLQTQAQAVFSSCKHHFHQQVMQFMVYAMGYDVALPQGCVAGTVTNNALSGDVGWLEIDAQNQIKEVLPK